MALSLSIMDVCWAEVPLDHAKDAARILRGLAMTILEFRDVWSGIDFDRLSELLHMLVKAVPLQPVKALTDTIRSVTPENWSAAMCLLKSMRIGPRKSGVKASEAIAAWQALADAMSTVLIEDVLIDFDCVLKVSDFHELKFDILQAMECDDFSSWKDVITIVHEAGGPKCVAEKLSKVRVRDFLNCASLLTECGLVRPADKYDVAADQQGMEARLEFFCDQVLACGNADLFLWTLKDVNWRTFQDDMYKINRWKALHGGVMEWPEERVQEVSTPEISDVSSESSQTTFQPCAERARRTGDDAWDREHFVMFHEWLSKLKQAEGRFSVEGDAVVRDVYSFMWRLTEHAHAVHGQTLSVMRTMLNAMNKDFFALTNSKDLSYLSHALTLVVEQKRRGCKLKQLLDIEFQVGPAEYRTLVLWLKKIGGVDNFVIGAKFLSRVPLGYKASCEMVALIHEIGLSHLTRHQWQCLALHLHKQKPDGARELLRSRGSMVGGNSRPSHLSSTSSMPPIPKR